MKSFTIHFNAYGTIDTHELTYDYPIHTYQVIESGVLVVRLNGNIHAVYAPNAWYNITVERDY